MSSNAFSSAATWGVTALIADGGAFSLKVSRASKNLEAAVLTALIALWSICSLTGLNSSRTIRRRSLMLILGAFVVIGPLVAGKYLSLVEPAEVTDVSVADLRRVARSVNVVGIEAPDVWVDQR